MQALHNSSTTQAARAAPIEMKRAAALVVVAAMLVLLAMAGASVEEESCNAKQLAMAGASVEEESCNAKQLAPCVPALTGVAGTPTAECCANMKAQQGCLCQFAKNPAYARYVGNPNTRRTIAACGVSPPHCK